MTKLENLNMMSPLYSREGIIDKSLHTVFIKDYDTNTSFPKSPAKILSTNNNSREKIGPNENLVIKSFQ